MERFKIVSHKFNEFIDAPTLSDAIDEFQANHPMEEITKTEHLSFISKVEEGE